MHNLLLLKWCDKNGKDRQTKIIASVCHKWKTITSLLYKGQSNMVEVLGLRYNNDPFDCTRQVFLDCFITNKPGRYSQDWNGIIELLKDIDEEALADEVIEWLHHR